MKCRYGGLMVMRKLIYLVVTNIILICVELKFVEIAFEGVLEQYIELILIIYLNTKHD